MQPALRVLAERHLHRTIQGGDKGHDSVEDARATMELAQLKIQNGNISTLRYLVDYDVDGLVRSCPRGMLLSGSANRQCSGLGQA